MSLISAVHPQRVLLGFGGLDIAMEHLVKATIIYVLQGCWLLYLKKCSSLHKDKSILFACAIHARLMSFPGSH